MVDVGDRVPRDDGAHQRWRTGCGEQRNLSTLRAAHSPTGVAEPDAHRRHGVRIVPMGMREHETATAGLRAAVRRRPEVELVNLERLYRGA